MLSREEVWIRAWVGVANASNTTDIISPGKWADQCLNEFDDRFSNVIEVNDEGNNGEDGEEIISTDENGRGFRL